MTYRLWPLWSRVARLHRRTIARHTRVVAVVGSLGKSTTTRAIAAALGLHERPDMLLNAWSRVAFALLRIRPGAPRAVVEVGIAAPGEMAVYARLVRPDIAVVTSIASEHHRSLGSLEDTRAEKSAMVRVLAASGAAVLNGDDPHVLWMRQVTAARVVTFGFDAQCDLRATDARLDWPSGSSFVLHAFGERRDVRIGLLGRPAIQAALAALAVAHVEGVPLDGAIERLALMAPTPGRMQPVAIGNAITVLRDEFKGPAESFHAALDVFAEVPASRRIALLGEISEPRGPQRALYQALGERVASMAAYLLVAGHTSTYESYAAGARRGGMAPGAVLHAGRTPAQITPILAALLQPGDVVLVKGRDRQRLDRVRLRLSGRPVRCELDDCGLRTVACASCPMLERGWNGRRAVMP